MDDFRFYGSSMSKNEIVYCVNCLLRLFAVNNMTISTLKCADFYLNSIFRAYTLNQNFTEFK